MIPVADSPRDPSHRPWTVLALIAANLLVGLVTLPLAAIPWSPSEPLPGVPAEIELSRLSWLLFRWGFRPTEPSLLTTFTAMFLHGGLMHLVGNMLYLWIYGPNVERRLGRVPFLLLYLTTGVLGTLLYVVTSLGSEIPAIGASGAISGVLGAYLILFPLNRIRMLLYVTTFQLPAWLVLLAFVVLDNLVPFALEHSSNVAHAAHLGGFFVGTLLAIGVRFLQPVAEVERRPRVDPLAHVQRLLRQGMLLDAHRALVELAASARPEVVEAARRQLEQLEADPTFQRAVKRGQ